MELIVDNRESIKTYFTEKNYNWVKYQNLLIGDYIFKHNDELITIIERKTIEDLAASINDGRYREQKHRLIKNYPLNKILYIIEGDLTKDNKSVKYNKVAKSTIYSSIINMYLRDNLNVFQSNNKKETIEFLESVANKITKQGKTFLKDKNTYENSIVNSVKISKKGNLTPELVYKAQLCSIPGISQKYALPIIEKYSTLPNLIQELSKLDTKERLEIIKNIQYKTNEKTRKLGKKVANNLVNYIFR